MNSLRCYTCLQQNRKLRPLKAQVKYLFALLCPEMFFKTKDTAQYLICWECEYTVDKIKKFQTKLKQANEILKQSLKGKTTVLEGLSSLNLITVQTLDLNLPSNAPTSPLPEKPPSPRQTRPQNEPTLQQDILKVSLIDLLQSPLKLDPPINVKGKCEVTSNSYDFDALVQPSTIPQLDALQIPKEPVQPYITMVWSEKEAPETVEIKNEIKTSYIPLKPFINPTKEQITLRGSKESVKVTVGVPKLEVEEEAYPSVVYKETKSIKNLKRSIEIVKMSARDPLGLDEEIPPHVVYKEKYAVNGHKKKLKRSRETVKMTVRDPNMEVDEEITSEHQPA